MTEIEQLKKQIKELQRKLKDLATDGTRIRKAKIQCKQYKQWHTRDGVRQYGEFEIYSVLAECNVLDEDERRVESVWRPICRGWTREECISRFQDVMADLNNLLELLKGEE